MKIVKIIILVMSLIMSIYAVDTLHCIANYEYIPSMYEHEFLEVKALGDVNADGFDDWAYVINGHLQSVSDSVYIFLGSDSIDFSSDHTISATNIAVVGDVNADGVDDIAFQVLDISSDWYNSEPILYILYGGNDFDIIPDDTCQVDILGRVGDLSPIGTLGDINGDGYDDIYSGQSYLINSIGAAKQSVHLGAENMSFEADFILNPPNRVDTLLMYDYHWGHCYAPLGDVNKDGFEDFALMYDDLPYDSEEKRLVYIYYGHSNIDSIISKVDTLLYKDYYRTFSYSDGIDGEGISLIYSHPKFFIDIYKDVDSLAYLRLDNVSDKVNNTGDINNDGYPDFFIHHFEPRFLNGYYGGENPDTLFDCVLPQDNQPVKHWTQYIEGVFIGDICGDGYDKFLVVESSEQYFPSNTNKYQIFCYSYNEVKTDIEPTIPNRYKLTQNYPNPFNPVTTIQYEMSSPEHVCLQIFDLKGQLITTLLDRFQEAGSYSLNWNAANYSSGIYVYRLQVGNIAESKKMVLLK